VWGFGVGRFPSLSIYTGILLVGLFRWCLPFLCQSLSRIFAGVSWARRVLPAGALQARWLWVRVGRLCEPVIFCGVWVRVLSFRRYVLSSSVLIWVVSRRCVGRVVSARVVGCFGGFSIRLVRCCTLWGSSVAGLGSGGVVWVVPSVVPGYLVQSRLLILFWLVCGVRRGGLDHVFAASMVLFALLGQVVCCGVGWASRFQSTPGVMGLGAGRAGRPWALAGVAARVLGVVLPLLVAGRLDSVLCVLGVWGRSGVVLSGPANDVPVPCGRGWGVFFWSQSLVCELLCFGPGVVGLLGVSRAGVSFGWPGWVIIVMLL